MDRLIHRAENIFKKRLIPLALICTMLISAAPLPSMAAQAETTVKNGGFESGNLKDWTVLTPGWGTNKQGAFTGVVNARSYWGCELPTNQSGNYHLSGMHNGIPEAQGWEIRSSTFRLSGSGWISVKMAGRAAAVKVYLKDGTQVGYYRQNRLRDVNYPYLSQGGSWYDMATYVMDLSGYLGKELYVVLCDETVEGSCATAVFDDVITYYSTAPDPTFRFDTVKDGHPKLGSSAEVRIPWVMGYNLLQHYSENDVKNGGFESGDLTDWTVLTKGFNKSSAVVNAQTYWEQELPYNQSGFYHLNGWNTGIPEEKGWAVRSSKFILGGSGYISVKMGGNAAVTKVFLSDGTQIGEYRNFRFRDVSFPYIAQGGAWCDMATYAIDLSNYLGQEMYLELHDEVITDGWANAFFDEVVTYYKTAPDVSKLYDKVPDGHLPGTIAKTVKIPWLLVPKVGTEAPRQVPNGDFETGDLSGWTVYGSGFPIRNGLPAASSDETYWDQELPYNKSGKYFVNGSALSGNEANTWRIRSSPFTLEGSGWISVKMGGHAAAVRVYKLDGTLVGDFDQSRFCDKDFPYLSKGGSWNDMATYLMDLSPNLGEVLYIELCDIPVNGGWANAFFDDVVTYYATKPTEKSEWVNDGHKPGEKSSGRVKIPTVIGRNNLYNPRNGGFEMGDLTGWTLVEGWIRESTTVLPVKEYDMDWKVGDVLKDVRRLPYNTSGNYIISGHDANPDDESATWTLRSSPFTLAGSGYISVKMGGATAAFQVRNADDNKILAYCQQRRFNDVDFPYISKGGSWRDMATYVMDLSPYLGQKLVIELMDEDIETVWANAYFDEIVTYYSKKPTTWSDTVNDGYNTWSETPKTIEIPWIYLDVFDDTIGRFPPSIAELKPSSSTVTPQTGMDLYDYVKTSQGLSSYDLEEGGLTITSVTYYGNDGTSTRKYGYTSFDASAPGCYVIQYQLKQAERTQTGTVDFVVADDTSNQIINGGFETGTMAGWTVVEGDGFNTGTAVISADIWWGEKVPYNQAGKYHLDGWETKVDEGKTWTVRSTTFTLDGSGWISWRMGGHAAALKVYTADNNTLVGYYKQTRFNDTFFPDVTRGSWADMGTYVADLSTYKGQKLYIELCDEAVSGSFAHAFFDEIVTNYVTAPDWKNSSDSVTNGIKAEVCNGETVSIPWQLAKNRLEADNVDPWNIINGDFEFGDLTGWTVVKGDLANKRPVISAETYMGDHAPYNQEGNYHLGGHVEQTGIAEGAEWAVRSSTFTLQGSGYISVRMGGHSAWVEVYKENGELVGEYQQTRFLDGNFPNIGANSFLDMGTYVIDLTDYVGQRLYIVLRDKSGGGPFDYATFDNVVTYYANVSEVLGKKDTVSNSPGQNPATVDIYWRVAKNLATPSKNIPANAQVENGGFETGNLDGWTPLTEGFTADTAVRSDETWDWGEKMPFNQAGNFHLDNRGTGIAEADGWAVRSSTFTLQGSGYISVRMGGRTAAVKVFLKDGTLVGYYKANRYSDTNFPDVTKGSWNDMATYVMDLSEYKGEEMYIELHDEKDPNDGGHWAQGFFDEVVTYYKDAPDCTKKVDLVNNGTNVSVPPAIVSIPWQLATNLADGTDGQSDEIEIEIPEQPDAAEAPAPEETPNAEPADGEEQAEPVESENIVEEPVVNEDQPDGEPADGENQPDAEEPKTEEPGEDETGGEEPDEEKNGGEEAGEEDNEETSEENSENGDETPENEPE